MHLSASGEAVILCSDQDIENRRIKNITHINVVHHEKKL